MNRIRKLLLNEQCALYRGTLRIAIEAGFCPDCYKVLRAKTPSPGHGLCPTCFQESELGAPDFEWEVTQELELLKESMHDGEGWLKMLSPDELRAYAIQRVRNREAAE